MNAQTKLGKMFKITYIYAAASGEQRGGALIIPATDIMKARETGSKKLAENHDWFKIGKITEEKNDHPQQQL